VEAIHGRPVGGTKSDVGANGGSALIRVEPQTRLARRAEAGVAVAGGVELGTERSQRAAVEADAGSRFLTFKPTWSNIAISSKKYEAMLGRGGQPFLENLAVAPRRAPVTARRYAGCTMEAAHEVGQIAEAGFERDVRDGEVFERQQLRGPA